MKNQAWAYVAIALAVALTIVSTSLWRATSLLADAIEDNERRVERMADWNREALAYTISLRDEMRAAGLNVPPLPKRLTDPLGEAPDERQED